MSNKDTKGVKSMDTDRLERLIAQIMDILKENHLSVLEWGTVKMMIDAELRSTMRL